MSLRAAAQSWPEKVVLDWQLPQTEELAENKTVTYLYFPAAQLCQVEEKMMPVWHLSLPCQSSKRLVLRMEQTEWEKLSSEEISCLPLSYLDTLTTSLQMFYGTTRHCREVGITVVPFRKNHGTYEKLRSFALAGAWEETLPLHATHMKKYASHSVLASGDIYRVELTKTGVYKLTYQALRQMGVPMGGLSIRNIAVYGNGGALMPENTHDAVYDDPQEIPVKVMDVDGDGIFDEEDCLLFYGQGIVKWNYSSGTLFEHTFNYFSDKACYFVKINTTPAKILSRLPSDGRAPTHVQTTFNFRTVMEQDLINPNECGRIWLQDQFDAITSQTYKFSLPALVSGEKAQMLLRLAVSSPSSSSAFSYKATGGSLSTTNFYASSGMFQSALKRF